MADEKNKAKQDAQEIGVILENAFQSMASNIQDIITESLDNTTTFAQRMNKSILGDIKSMAKIGDTLASNNAKLEEGLLSVEEIDKQLLKNRIKVEGIERKINAAKLANVDISEDLAKEYKNAVDYNEQITKELNKQKSSQEKIDEKMGGMGNIVKGMGKIPFVGQFLETDKALVAMAKSAGKGAGKMKVMGAGIKSMGASLAKAGPQILLLELAKAIGRVDAELVEMSKGLNMSKQEAGLLRNELKTAATRSNDIFVTTTKLIAAQHELNKAFGTAAAFTGEILVQATKLMEKVKLTGAAVAGLAGQSIVVGESFEANYENSLLTSYEMQRQTGISVDLRNVMTQVGSTTGALRAQLGGSTKEITRAVTQAELLGMNMKDIANSSKSLLDFESSINAELEAELLTGKQLNLEKARLAALTGNQEMLQKELNKNIGSFSEFSDMNVLQQDALAKSMGMTSDALADILYKQEIQGKTARELRALGKDELADRMEATTAQDKFNAMMTKLQGILADLVTPIIPLLDMIMSVINPIFKLLTFFDPLVKTVTALVTSIVDALGWVFTLGTREGGASSAAWKDVGASLIESDKMLGIEHELAEGGIIPASPGGTLATIGEGGQSEAVIPLNKAKEMGFGGTEIDYNKMALAMSKARVNVTTKHDSFSANSTTAHGGNYQSEARYESKYV